MPITPTVEHLRAALRRGASAVAVAALLLLAAGGGPAPAQQKAPEQSSLQAVYNASIYEAAVYKFSNVRQLRPLEFNPVTRKTRVVTLTDFKGYARGEFPISRYVWVTAVPEVQERCRGFTGDVEMRLRQLLGLPPGQEIIHFVVMDVSQGDIFRPAASDDPTTTLPCPSCPTPPNCGEVFPANVKREHVRWFAEQMLSSYLLAEVPLMRSGFPWTRLGYTYDWKPGADKYGASEYVIRPDSTVTVVDIKAIKDYCSPPPKQP